ncbi:glycoside hydrolase family 3 N-terminal domain-containing protein [Spirosoma sp. SC4-14]|uniref:glycoside hydrolase family 3 protein n=1 Tax=Spirosoma sp. SC4-14 TaxID=3128900 RepID=UPI0030CD2110
MKRLLKWLLYGIGGLIAVLLLTYIFFFFKWQVVSSRNRSLLGPEVSTLTVAGYTFRDLNKNGKLDGYEDSRLPTEQRVENLLSQMTLDEKAGLLFITMIPLGTDGAVSDIPGFSNPFSLIMETPSTMLVRKKMNHFNFVQSLEPDQMLTWHNGIQKMAERTRLGIPVTLASDPRHVATNKPGIGIKTPGFSNWCGPLGFAAIGDTTLMREFGDIARQEYRAMGIRLALSPQIDLATEPRWARFNGTFGEDATLTASLTKAFILGFQGDSIGTQSVACMAKHFPGGGAQKDGEDSHFAAGRAQAFPGRNFPYHLIPYEQGAFPAHVAQIMPNYSIPVGQTSEDVAAAFNKDLITGLLRKKYHFDGVVCTDWAVVNGIPYFKEASAWGVENLTPEQRVEKILNAGCDMFGGEAAPELVISLVKRGKISEDRINTSVRRVLRDKFRLGLFDQPYLTKADQRILGNPVFIRKGREAQRRSLVLLKNENLLPLKKRVKLYIQGFDETVVKQFAEVVARPEEADYVLLKLNTPYTPRHGNLMDLFIHQGRLDFPADEKEKLLALMKIKPTITILSVDRPMVIPELNAQSRAVIADFDCEDRIVLELIMGRFKPTGKLPFEFPSSVQSVEQQKEDLPYDSSHPLYAFGAGLSYR